MKGVRLVSIMGIVAGWLSVVAQAEERPNIVYIALEDIAPMMGCYGDTYAKTPVFDKLAEEGIRYTHAYSVNPVCSPSRSSIVTGIYPTSLGTMHHRSNVGKPPAFLEMIPNQMCKAGYYTTNNAKQDYNIGGANWNKNGGKAHWRNRPDKAQPFFAKFDFGECHSSITKVPEDVIVQKRLNRLKSEDFHDPAKAPIPPYHPEDPVFRKAWSRYYDAVTQVDYRAGEIIKQLKEDGLWDDTIVIVWADHGVGMPRGKHTVYEQGTHVPLIIRYPKKYQHLATAEPGSVLNDLVCLMDMGPSVLKLAGIETPDYMHGRALLCQSDAEKRDYVVATRDRLDSRFEMVRSIRDKRYRYQRNFYPHLPYKPYEDFEFNAPALQRWVQLAREGKLTGDQEMLALRFKLVEELYDSENDPHMVRNVAGDPEYTEVLERMRRRLGDWMVETRDLGMLEEAELHRRAEGKSAHWEVGEELDNYERILETANLQLQGQAAVPELKARSKDPDPAIRFWGVLGLAVVTQTAGAEMVAGIVPTLKESLQDDSVSVRLTAAEGLCNLGHYTDAVDVLCSALADPSISARIRSACILDTQPPEADGALLPAIEYLEEAAAKTNVRRLGGIPYGLNDPFGRALKAITGEKNYYRWGMGASGSPKSPLMKVQEKPFVPRSETGETEKPNILFILVDDMGWRDLACYGHVIHETPHIDRLAADGMRFTDAYAACPICAPSRAAIMTGKLPSNTGFVDNYVSQLDGQSLMRSKDRQFLKLAKVTLAETFKAGGYQTGFLGKWHLSKGMEPRQPTDQGFDVNVAGSFWGHPLKGYFSPYQMPNLKDGPKGEYLTDRLTSEAIRVMDDFAKQDKPWLLYLSYYTVHGPFHSKPEKTKKYAAKARQAKVKLKNPAYSGMVESLDENVGRLLDWLDEEGLRKNTIIVFTSDNGGMVRATENRPLRSYKGDLYEGGIRVPCIIDWPGVIQPGSVSDTPVHGVDFYATLLAMTGLPQQPESHEDSVNLVPLLKGNTDFEREPMVWHYPVGVPHIAHSKPGSVIRVGDWKYLRFYEDGREELYNLKDDIGETKNFVASMPDKAAKMKRMLDDVLKEHNATIPTSIPAKPSRPATKKRTRTE